MVEASFVCRFTSSSPYLDAFIHEQSTFYSILETYCAHIMITHSAVYFGRVTFIENVFCLACDTLAATFFSFLSFHTPASYLVSLHMDHD